MSEVVELHPAWRQALLRFRERGFNHGEIVDLDWLYMVFRIERPTAETTKAASDKAELAFLSQFIPFRDALLAEDQIALTSERGLGYRIVPPKEQTRWAEDEGRAALAKALRQMQERISHVDLVQLTADERVQNANALARVGQMRALMRKTYRALPAPAPQQEEVA